MAIDNIAVTPGSGAVVAAEACSGTANALVQRIKLVLGATDTDSGNVSSANPMPVLSGTAGQFLVTAAGTVTTVSGTAANMLVSASGTVTVLSGTAGNLLCTVTQGSSVTVISGTAGNLLSQVSGMVTAVSGTAANLLVQASGTITATGTVTAVSGTSGNFLASVSGTVTATGTVTVISGTAANLLAKVSGGLTSNNAAPGATNEGVLPAIANAVAQTWTEGNQVLLSTDLAGNLRTTATLSIGTASVTVVSGTAANLLAKVNGGLTNNNAAPGATNVGALVAIANAASVTYAEGDQVLLSTDLSGNVRVTGSLSVGGSTDQGAFTPATSTGTPAMGYYSTTTASVGSGQAAVVAIDKWRHLQSVIVDAAGNSRGANVTSGNAMLVDASATVQPVLSGTAANFLTNSTVSCGTAANMLVTAIVSCGTASTLLAQVSQGTASNLLATVSCGTAANMLTTALVSCGTAANLLSQVSQGTAANLLATVTNAAGTALMGQVISGQQMTIYNGTAALTVSYASISFTASAGNTVISGVASKNIYILSGLIIAQNATNLQFWQNSTASTALSGVLCMTANMGFQLPYVPIGNLATVSTGQPVQISSSVATTVGGWLTYVAF